MELVFLKKGEVIMKMRFLRFAPLLVATFLVISVISIKLKAVDDDADFKLFKSKEDAKLIARGGGGHGGGGHGGGGRSFSGGHGGGRGGSRGVSRSSRGSRGGHGVSRGSKGGRGGHGVRHGGRGGGHGGGHGGRGRGHGGRGHGGHHGHHGGHGGHHHWHDRGWRGSYWGAYWAAPWYPGLFWYPGIAAWYWEPYGCLVSPVVGIGYGLAFASLGYWWYPSINVGVYPSTTVVYVENEDDSNSVYYAVYRKVIINGDPYLIKVSSPTILSTKKRVKIYLPEDASEDKEYEVVTRRNEDDFKDYTDEDGNIPDEEIIGQIKKEQEEIQKPEKIKADEDLSEDESSKLDETKATARKDESKLREGLAKIEVNKDKVPSEKELATKKGTKGKRTVTKK